MRAKDRIPAARSRTALSGALIALLTAVLSRAPVSGASDEPTAGAAKKKKCKKPLWKCAPKRYHLSVTDAIGPGSQSAGIAENWRAEIDLVRYRRKIGHVDYSQAGGTVSVSTTFPTECSGGPGTIRVEPQTLPVPATDLNNSDFAMFFSLIGPDKNTYGGSLGYATPGLSHIIGTALEQCPKGTRAFRFYFSGPKNGIEGRGKVGKVLTGSGVSSTIFEHHSFSWRLTPGK